VDSQGHVQGNCKTTDSTGARWCYIDASYGSSCQDLTPSARFPANPWSYEACATPNVGSYECPSVVVAPSDNHVHVPSVIVAPADNHIHVPSSPTVVISAPHVVAPSHVVISAPHVVAPSHVVVSAPHVVGPSHVVVSAPHVVAHDPIHTHFDRNEIPQGPYLAPIPKSATVDTAFPTK